LAGATNDIGSFPGSEGAAHRSTRVLQQRLGDDLRRQARIYAVGLMRSKKHNPRFVVFGRGRSGSTLLVDLLGQLPGVHCDGEILRDRVLAPRLFVRCRESLAPGQAYGFKLLTYQLPKVQGISDGGAFLRYLDSLGYQIVYLKRRNLLRHALSNLYARHQERFHHRVATGTPEATRMTVDVEELQNWLRNSEQWARYEDAALSGLGFLDVVYERDLQTPDEHQRTVNRVAQYLGIPAVPVRTGLARMTSDDLAEFVSNPDEVVRFVQSTEYREFLS
jgi:LPS sulfotransferase NodH